MIQKLASLVCIALLFFSCKGDISSPDHPTTTKVIDIKLSESKNIDKSFSSYIKDFSYLELKTNSETYISEISKVQVFKNEFYVLDQKKSNLLVFDSNGNFKRKIGQKGDGPEEYKDISDFAINTLDKTISILSNRGIKIFKYNLKGDFIKSIAFSNFFPRRMTLIDNTYYALHTGNSNNSLNDLVFADTSGNIVKEDFKYPDDIFGMGFSFTGGISKFGDSFLYSQATDPTIYEIDIKLKHNIIYQIDIGTNAWKEENKFDLDKFNNRLSNMEMAYLNNNFFINNAMLYFNYTDGNKLKRGFYTINSKNLHTTDSFIQNGLNLIFYNYVGIDSENRNIVAYMPEYYKEYSNHFKGLGKALENLDSELFQKFKNADEDSNQYLLFFNLSL